MPTILGSTIQRSLRKPGERLNVLTAPTHESYQSSMQGCNADFYLFRGQGIKDWNPQYRQLPKNYTLLDPRLGINQIPRDLEFDVVLSQNVEGQFPVFQHVSKALNIPLVTICHTLPHPQANQQYIDQARSMKGDINLYISDFSREKWGASEEGEVIHHGIDTGYFKSSTAKRENKALSVVNLLKDRDIYCGYHIWEEATKGIERTLLGDNQALGYSPAKNIFDLVKNYQTHQVFLNTSKWSPIPTSLLEAASCECAIVSTTNCCIPEIFTHEKDALLSNDPVQLRGYIQRLFDNPDLARKLGQQARKTVQEKFGIKKFVENWDNVFARAIKL